MTIRSPHRGEVFVYEASGVAIAVQSLGWDASMARRASAVVALHGFVGNWDELRESHGIFLDPSESHAARVAAAFDEIGERIVSLLRGEFAVVIHDIRRDRVLVARDVVGCRPLFLQDLGGRCLVASEVRQVVAGSKGPAKPNKRAFAFHIVGEPPVHGETLVDGINGVMPGEIYSFIPGQNEIKISREEYWNFWEALPDKVGSLNDWLDELDRLIRRAVMRWLPDHPCAHTLSGGLDASALWAKFVELRAQGLAESASVRPISLVYPGLPCDELEFVERILRDSCDQVLAVDGSKSPVVRGRASAAKWLDTVPYMSSHLLQLLAGAAAEDGRLSLITGNLGDELFNVRACSIRRRAALSARVVLNTALGRSRASRTYARLRSHIVGDSRDMSLGILRQPTWQDEIRERSWTRILHSCSPSHLVFNRLENVRTGRSFPGWEQICASQGVEVRHPLADPDVIAWASKPPRELLVANVSKPALRKVSRGVLPRMIVDRLGKIGLDCLENRSHLDIIDAIAPERCFLVSNGIIDPAALDRLFSAADNENAARYLLFRIEETEAYARTLA